MSRTIRIIAVSGLAWLLALSLAAVPAASSVGEGRAERTVVPQPPAQVVISTVGAAPVVSRDDYVEATVQLDGLTHAAEIKGRGNSTWGFAKKPYKLKLATSAALVGTTPQEEWVLLANAADRSALRTQAAFALAQRTRLAWTPQTRYVELVLNGQSLGLYQLTEQVEATEGRVELPDDGFLLEINQRFVRDGEQGFRTVRRRTPVSFKDPDEPTRGQRFRVRLNIQKFEKALYGKDFTHPRRGYRRYVDIGTFVDWYLVEEFFRNQDSNFYSSVFFSWSPGEKVAMGPVWDFDLSAGSKFRGSTPPGGWATRLGRHWLARMLQDPAFAQRVKRRWAALRPVVDELISQLPAAAAPLRTAAEADWQQWHSGAEMVPGSKHGETFDGEVAFLGDWLTKRAAWMSQPEASFSQRFRRVTEKDRVVRLQVTLLGRHDQRVTVDYGPSTGTATQGADFALAPGTLVFEPGQTSQSIPIALSDDKRTEGRETIKIALAAGAPGVIVGTPGQITVKIDDNDAR